MRQEVVPVTVTGDRNRSIAGLFANETVSNSRFQFLMVGIGWAGFHFCRAFHILDLEPKVFFKIENGVSHVVFDSHIRFKTLTISRPTAYHRNKAEEGEISKKTCNPRV